ncbi:unnamed protein product [Calypogeia fissa]
MSKNSSIQFNMAAMRREPIVRDIDPGLGSIGIIRDAIKVFWMHAKVFFLIQLALLLELAIVAAVGQYFLFKYLPEAEVPPQPEPDHGPEPLFTRSRHLLHNIPRVGGHSFKGPFHGDSDPAGILQDLAVIFLAYVVGSISFQAVLSLPLSITLYSVGLHYAGQAVSFVDVIKACTPTKWMRLAVTNTYIFVIFLTIMLLEAAGALLIFQSNVPMLWAGSATMLLAVVTTVGLYYLQMIFSVAMGVSVLEEDYGWASMKRGVQLLKGKKAVAFWLQILLAVPGVIPYMLQSAIRNEFEEGDYSAWSVTVLVLEIVVYLAFTTFYWQFLALCQGVQWMSFKAYHDGKVSLIKGGYERIGDGSKAALPGDHQQADNAV